MGFFSTLMMKFSLKGKPIEFQGTCHHVPDDIFGKLLQSADQIFVLQLTNSPSSFDPSASIHPNIHNRLQNFSDVLDPLLGLTLMTVTTASLSSILTLLLVTRLIVTHSIKKKRPID